MRQPIGCHLIYNHIILLIDPSFASHSSIESTHIGKSICIMTAPRVDLAASSSSLPFSIENILRPNHESRTPVGCSTSAFRPVGKNGFRPVLERIASPLCVERFELDGRCAVVVMCGCVDVKHSMPFRQSQIGHLRVTLIVYNRCSKRALSHQQLAPPLGQVAR